MEMSQLGSRRFVERLRTGPLQGNVKPSCREPPRAAIPANLRTRPVSFSLPPNLSFPSARTVSRRDGTEAVLLPGQAKTKRGGSTGTPRGSPSGRPPPSPVSRAPRGEAAPPSARPGPARWGRWAAPAAADKREPLLPAPRPRRTAARRATLPREPGGGCGSRPRGCARRRGGSCGARAPPPGSGGRSRRAAGARSLSARRRGAALPARPRPPALAFVCARRDARCGAAGGPLLPVRGGEASSLCPGGFSPAAAGGGGLWTERIAVPWSPAAA